MFKKLNGATLRRAAAVLAGHPNDRVPLNRSEAANALKRLIYTGRLASY
jgi:hypothetical protein